MVEPHSPVVLVAPAMAVGSRFYRPLATALQAHGWVVELLPRRGFEPGQRPASRTEDWSYADEVAVIAAAVTRARGEHPDRAVVVLGHSLGGQLAVGAELAAHGATGADGLVTVGTSLPHRVDFPRRGPGLWVMAAVVVPVSVLLLGHLRRPAFGAPGPRTMMGEWARMVRTGRAPYAVDRRLAVPSLVVSLEGDALCPERSVDRFVERVLEPSAVTRWTYRDADVPPGSSNGHLDWVRRPEPVVERVVAWWADRGVPAR